MLRIMNQLRILGSYFLQINAIFVEFILKKKSSSISPVIKDTVRECILHDEQDHGHQGPLARPQDDALRV